MNYPEFVEYVLQYSKREAMDWAALAALPSPPQKAKWEEVVKAIEPHLDGKMPPSIHDAFPNETKEQKKYRERVFQSRTMGTLWAAMAEVQRITMGEKMQFQISEALYERLKESYSMGRYFSLERWAMDYVYKARVRDPNGLLATIPTNINPEDATQPLGAKFEVIASEDILHQTEALVLTSWPYGSILYNTQVYRLFTLTNYMVLARTKDGGIEVLVDYPHGNEKLGLEKLGGTLMTYKVKKGMYQGLTYKYHDSDFAFAVPVMNDCEVANNQLKVVTANAAFPTRIVRGVTCDSCKGRGQIQRRHPETGELCWLDEFQERPDMHECQKCNGRGTLPIGALDQIVVPDNIDPLGGSGPEPNLQTGFLQYVSPDTSSIVEIRTQKTLLAGELDEVLNITKPSKFTESGIAKEKDREGRQTMLKSIADGVAELIQNSLYNAIDYVFPVPELQAQNQEARDNTYIKAPQSFNIKTLAELENEYFTNLEQKPLTMRKEQYLELVRKRFGDDAKELIIESTAIDYTFGNYLRTKEELEMLLAQGALPNGVKDVYLASIVGTLCEQAYRLLKGDFVDYDRVRATLDQLAQPLLAAFDPPPSPNQGPVIPPSNETNPINQ